MIQIITLLAAGSVLFSGCLKNLDLGSSSYLGVASIGELVRANVKKDRFRLEVEGARGGSVIDGTLQPMPRFKNFYTLREAPSLVVGIIPNDLIFYRSPQFGKLGVAAHTQQMPYRVTDIAGIYNFVAQYWPNEIQASVKFGTLELGADNTWRVWNFKDGSADNSGPKYHGSWVDKGDGVIIAHLSNNVLYAKLSLSDSNGGELIIIDLIKTNGIGFGLKKKAIIPGSVEGDFFVLHTNKNSVRIAKIHNNMITHGPRNLAIHYNEPWEGFIKDNRGEFLGLFSPNGICLGINIGTVSGRRYLFIGMKNT